MNKEIIYKEMNFAGRKLTFETGKLAVMSNMAVKATYGDTTVLVTVVSGGSIPDTDFFPLSINYQEKFFSSGLIKSSRFQKREGRATDDAIIAGRVIDHAVRPLFPNDFMDEVQVVATVLSLDQDCDPHFLSMITTSAALCASNIPWNGPMVSAEVGYVKGEYVLNPTHKVLEEESDLDMMVSFNGPEKKFLALEAEANIIPEDQILGAIEYARTNTEDLYKFIEDFAKTINPENEKYVYEPKTYADGLVAAVEKLAKKKIYDFMLEGWNKAEMVEKFTTLTEEVQSSLEGKFKKVDIQAVLEDLKKYSLRQVILDKNIRPDGRGLKEVRQITSEVGVLPRVHGSGLFTRGLTQVLTVATLASPSQALLIQDLYGERAKKFLHYYDFPPYASGEVGKLGYPKNREIGHGMIAENALRPVLPSQKEFPYMILLNSQTMSSSGSTSMASTCGSTLALMDAGVPISDMVGGISIGLVATDDFSKYLLLTDIAYMEDAFGLMDFKITGTRTGITAIQCDMKVQGLPIELLPKIFEQSKEARLGILDIMKAAISEPRKEVSQYAPKTVSIHIDPDKIGMVIGSGGKTIKEIQESTQTEVSIEEDGSVVVSSLNLENSKKAAQIIADMTRDVAVGEVYDGVVEDVADFGAFVELFPGKTGLLHISEISNVFVKDIYTVIKAGDKVKVKVMEVSRDGKISLSKKILEPGYVETEKRERDSRPSNRDSRPGNRGRR